MSITKKSDNGFVNNYRCYLGPLTMLVMIHLSPFLRHVIHHKLESMEKSKLKSNIAIDIRVNITSLTFEVTYGQHSPSKCSLIFIQNTLYESHLK